MYLHYMGLLYRVQRNLLQSNLFQVVYLYQPLIEIRFLLDQLLVHQHLLHLPVACCRRHRSRRLSANCPPCPHCPHCSCCCLVERCRLRARGPLGGRRGDDLGDGLRCGRSHRVFPEGGARQIPVTIVVQQSLCSSCCAYRFCFRLKKNISKYKKKNS